uniref:Cellulase family glycosylhydrolase n=1 Tax=Roseihalotalea indica TaxID=2867963 RepID=A0AA49Q0C9_9BACT|nr:cellulase family glycosylhydrolase [Tunicatimonas sp. TK19036]
MSRRDFVKASSLSAVGIGLTGTSALAANTQRVKNKIPQWKGFNLLDFFSPDPAHARPATTEEYFRWISDWGFDFVRIPMAYPSYLDIDRTKNITPDEVYNIDERAVDNIDRLVTMAHKHGLHVSLNLHRAPGYCVNAGFYEPYNLWTDPEALEAFCYHWEMWAKRYKNISSDKISFDLVNEPSMRADMNDQHSLRSTVPGDVYRKVAKAASEAIRKYNPDHLVIADGNDVGKSVIPEITDLNIAQSCRGYYPGLISHYKAPWANKDPDSLPEPTWPAKINVQPVLVNEPQKYKEEDLSPEVGPNGERYLVLGRQKLEEYYQPWVELVNSGVGVHCGECGCWNKTPHNVFLAWFGDVLDILSTHGIGFAIWEFAGSFGVLDSEREDVDYEDWYGHKLDRKMLDLLTRQ